MIWRAVVGATLVAARLAQRANAGLRRANAGRDKPCPTEKLALAAHYKSIKRDEIDGSCREVNRQRALNYLHAAAIAAIHRGDGELARQLRYCHAARRG